MKISWIDSQLNDSKPLTDIVVETFGQYGVMEKVRLTAEIWQRSLIRGPWRGAFLPLWNEYNRVRNAREAILSSLSSEVTGFTQACQNFIHDLRTFGGDKGSRQRLEGTGHEFYLGSPYFSTSTREKLLKIPTKKGTLETDLRALSDKRRGGEICAAHDLSPIFEAILSVSWDKSRNKGVAINQQMGGLSIQGEPSKVKQIAKKGSQMFKKAFNKGGLGRGRKGGDGNSSMGV
jgi:hypothetical protein